MAGFDYDDFDDGYDSYEDGGGELEYGHVDDHLVYDENGHMISGGDPIIQQIRAELDSRSDEVTDDQIQQALTLNLSDLDKTVEYLFTEFLDRERMNTACSTIMIALGPDASYTTEAKVKESLYYYYYDADKTFEYIARTIKTAKANESKREAEARKFQPSSTTAPGTPSTSDKSAKVPSKPSFNKPQHKNIDVASEYKHRIAHEKNRASFVVTGHVDAGKSTLMGRLLLDLHEVDESLISRFRHEATNMGKQSFALAWVMDQNAEERERGVTVDVTSHTFETDKTHYTILDAPGHRAFVHNAIYGVSQADFAILVLDGNTGAFEKGIKGQTYEHILLLRSLGIQRIVVAINKLDMVNWSQDRYDEIKEQITAFLYKFDFSPNNLQFVPISGLNGDNVVTRPNNDSFSWYQGPTLVEALDRDEPLPRVLDHPMRMMISDLWSTGAGKLTASGRIEIGTVQVGDQLLITPSKESCYVQSILVGHETRDWAVAGENVDFVVVGVEATSINAGDVLSAFDSPLEPKKELVLKALAFQPLYPLSIDLHRGRLQCSGQINKVMAILDRKTGFITNSRATRVDAGEVARISVTVNQELPVEAGQRVVIRSGEHTIAAGVVE